VEEADNPLKKTWINAILLRDIAVHSQFSRRKAHHLDSPERSSLSGRKAPVMMRFFIRQQASPSSRCQRSASGAAATCLPWLIARGCPVAVPGSFLKN
jgi:hypothetical protein